MMPLSFAALISGMLTLVATAPNLVVNAELVRQGAAGFHFFSVTPFGLPVLVLGIVYMLFARRWLAATSRPGRRRAAPAEPARLDRAVPARRARVPRARAARLAAGRQAPRGAVAARRRREPARDRARPPVQDRDHPARRAQTELQAGDVLLIDVRAPEVEIEALRQAYAVEPLPLGGDGGYLTDRAAGHRHGRGHRPGRIRAGRPDRAARRGSDATYGLTVIGLRRGQAVHGQGLLEEKLAVGDTLLLVGFWKDIERLHNEDADHGGPQHAGRARRGPAGRRQGAACARHPGARRRR